MDDPLVTIVITSYNYGEYVADAIRSALAQTYPNIEVLVLDNASTDNSVEIIRTFTGDKRLRLIAREQNVGIQRNHNDGIDEARGEFVVFLSADDMMFPSLVSDIMAERRKRPNVDLVYASVLIMDKSGNVHGYFDHPQFDGAESYHGRNEFAKLLTRDSCMYLPTMLFPKRVFDKLGKLDESLTVVLDYEYDIRMASSGLKFSFFAKPEAMIRFHGENRSGANAFVKSGGQLREFGILLERYTQPRYHEQLAGYRHELHAMVDRKVQEISAQYPAEYSTLRSELEPFAERAKASIAALPDIGNAVLRGEGLIGVVVPFSGRMNCLHRALLSLKSQTYANWEAVVACDGTFDPEGLIDSMGLSDRVRVTRLRREARGPGAARNAALHGLNAEIVAYLDDDDWFAPEYLANLAARFSDPSVNATIGRAPLGIYSRNEGVLWVSDRDFASHAAGRVSWVSNRAPISAVAHRRFALPIAGYFRPDLPVLEDWEFLMRLTRAFPLHDLKAQACTVGVDAFLEGHRVFGRRTSAGWSEYATQMRALHDAYPVNSESERSARALYLQNLEAVVQRGINGIGNVTEVAYFVEALAGPRIVLAQ
jgi:glycosyltransferase involved in cell wall biosynthesis